MIDGVAIICKRIIIPSQLQMADIEVALQQPHGNQEDENACIRIHILGKDEC